MLYKPLSYCSLVTSFLQKIIFSRERTKSKQSLIAVLVVPSTVCTFGICIRVRPRLFDQVGHQTTNASVGNKYFSTKYCHRQTYQNYEQSRQKLGTFLENKVLQTQSFQKIHL